MSININHTTNKIEQASGDLQLGSTPVVINSVGAISVNGSFGSTGQVLTSNSSTGSVTWTTVSGGGGVTGFDQTFLLMGA